MSSLIPRSLTLTNGSSVFKINNNDSALTLYGKYEMPNAEPTSTNNVMVWNGNGSASFSNALTNLQNSINVYANNIYVSSVSGSDSVGDGSIHNSFKTLTRALEYAGTFADTIPITINLSSGVYSESVVVSRNLTSIVGASSSNPNLTQVSGSITFNITPSVSTNIVSAGIAHLYLNNIIHTGSNAYGNSIVVNNCLIVPPSTYNAISTSYSGSGLCPDTTVSNSLIRLCLTA